MNAQADTILGFYIGAYAWQTGISGDFDIDGAGTFSIDDSDLDDETSTVIYAALEHPVPVLPNIRLTQTDIEFEEGDAVLDLNHTDVHLYYEVLDNIVSIDLGIVARMYDGEVVADFSGGGTPFEEEIDSSQALGYILVRGDLPFTGLALGAELAAGQDSTTDANLYIEYETPIGLGFAAGYRSLTTDLEIDDDNNADLDIDGGYLSIFFHL